MLDRRTFLGRGAAALGSAALLSPRDAAALFAGGGRRADLMLRRGRIYDGSGGAPYEGDVAVAGGRIVEVGARLSAQAGEELDLQGLALAPGFIDIHSHTETVLLRDPRADSKVRQGVTTEVPGQDGSSILWNEEQARANRERYARDGVDVDFHDLGGFLDWIDAHGAAVNLASMVGAGTIRGYVVGQDNRPATDEEMARMVALVQQALASGACGVSSGLEYTPGAFADAAELQALATPLHGTGLPFASHMRNEDDRVLGAIEEIIGVGQRAGAAIEISHLKAQGQRNWWKAESALHLLEAARAAGVDAMFDVYPYIAYSTGLSNLFPVWAREGGTDDFLARLADPATAPLIERAVRDKIALLGSWDAVQMAGAGADFAWVEGQRLGTLAKQRGVEPYALLLQIIRGDRAHTGMIGFGMSEDNVAMQLAHPLAMVCSDGAAVPFGRGSPHPRNYGTFPRVLGHFVRERKALSLESAIRKMTALPAKRLRFEDRGRIAVGAAADLVVFDPDKVADRATYENPHQYPVGIPHVIVNGTFVIRDGEHTEARPGRAVRPSRG